MKDGQKKIGTKELNTPGNIVGATRFSDSENSLDKPTQQTSESLSKDVATQLLGLMKNVVKDEISPQTVNSACKCAREIHGILKLNLEMKKAGL